MRRYFSQALVLVCVWAASAALAKVEKFKIDAGHSAVMFKAHHFESGYTWGRFTELSGDFSVNEKNPAQNRVSFEVGAGSVNTHNKKRDDHLRGPDFLNAGEHPKIKFSSTSVKKVGDKYQVKGPLTLNGVTKEITLMAVATGRGNDPWGNIRYGVDVEHKIALSDFKIKGVPGAVGNEIQLYISFEGMRKK